MNAFPLHTFLATLAADGIRPTVRDYERIGLILGTGGPWTLTRLRDTLLSLLTKSADEQALFLRRFDSFFEQSPDAENTFPALDIEPALEDLKQLIEGQTSARKRPVRQWMPKVHWKAADGDRDSPRPNILDWRKLVLGPGARLWWVWLIIVLLAVPVTWRFWPKPPLPVSRNPPLVNQPVTEPPPTARTRLYTNVPCVENISIELMKRPGDWQKYAGLGGFFLLATLCYGFYLWHSRKLPEDKLPQWNREAPRHFRLAAIGGKPDPRLNDAILSELAQSMGYFQSEDVGRTLNVAASIEATVRQGGMTTLEFHKRKQIRSLLILEDSLARPTTWNPIAEELADGMTRHGVPVLYGRFAGTPEQFKTPDGSLHRLEDLEDNRRGYLLLIFTDGKGFHRRQSVFALEALARWPMMAWMELREPRFWDEASALPTRYGIPIYPATPSGTVEAVRRFLTEQAAAADFSAEAIHGEGIPSRAGIQMDAYVEKLLGDALLWAQDCAMLQPMSQGLADDLRRKFHSHLPPERIERLYALPGTLYNVSGIRFSNEVLKILRRGFSIRRDADEQRRVLETILEQIDEAEPEPLDSMAHLAWEAVKERVRLDLDADNDLSRLGQLAKSPLGNSISASLENFGFPDDPDKIPLRVKPRNKDALQRLARIAPNLNIPALEAYPVGWGHRLVLVLMCLLCLGFSGWSVKAFFDNTPPDGVWEVVGLEAEPPLARLEFRDGAKWQVEGRGTIQELTRKRLTVDRDYRLILYGGGCQTIREGIKGAKAKVTRLTLKVQDVQRPCHEELFNGGLIVERCADAINTGNAPVRLMSWRERLGAKTPPNRLMSLGLEIFDSAQSEPTLKGVRNTLLETGSVDVVYRIQPDRSGAWHIDEALAQLERDLSPWIAQSQLLFWTNLGAKATPKLPVFERTLILGEDGNPSWMAALQGLLAPGANERVTETEIRAVVGSTRSTGTGADVVLIRPLTTVGALTVFVQDSTGGRVSADLTLTQGRQRLTGKSGETFTLEAGYWLVEATATNEPSARQTVQIVGGKSQTITINFSAVPPDMALILAGEFEMGDNFNEGNSDERRVHTVYIDAFYMDVHEVTVGEYRAFIQATGYQAPDWKRVAEYSPTDQHPMINVSWYDATAYCRWANKRLPTEAEWEKAARGGLVGKRYPWGDEDPDGTQCNFADKNTDYSWSNRKVNDGYQYTAPVEKYTPNGYRLYDMAGNVWEWCMDEYQSDFYAKSPKQNPVAGGVITLVNNDFTDIKTARVLRGGSWSVNPDTLCVAGRYRGVPSLRNDVVGFRCARALTP
ncbi:formylglycine-generating enzyme family protein [Candidatus Poribacteria bacterium]|nr:formylglycine-generating enzyme family protein [Candidatus Poribacteria bacterium]